MSNSFYTADGRKVMLENFADATKTPTVDDSLRLRGNLALDGNIRARKYILEDGSEMKQIIQEQTMTALPKNVAFDPQGNMVVNGIVTSSKGIMVDGPANVNKYSLSASGINTIGSEGWWTVFRQHSNEGWRFNDEKNQTAVSIKSGSGDVNVKGKVDVGQSLNVTGDVTSKGTLTAATKLCVGNKCADQNTFMASTDGGNRGFDTIRARAGDNGTVQTPNGELRINKQAIMFGGPNAAGMEVNSAQISAGLHIPNSLNIVGMGKTVPERRVDMWAEGGFNVNGNANINGNAKARVLEVDSIKIGGMTLSNAGDNTLRITSPNGTVEIGAKNGNWAHIYSDKPAFAFNKPVVDVGAGEYAQYRRVDKTANAAKVGDFWRVQ